MRPVQQSNPFSSIGNGILDESMRHGPVLTVLVMAAISIGAAYLIYSYVLSGWAESNDQYRQAVIKKEAENKRTEQMLAGEPHFRAEFKKIVDLYNEAKPLLPQETEISDVLGQVEMAAQRNGVTLTGLMAVKDSVKSPAAEKLYEREIPAVVTGPYPQVVRFFADISKMPRILLVRDYSVVSLKSNVTAGFTLVAYHAPPPAEMPKIPADLALNQEVPQ
ncbi:MAG TPA: type 4a pilus biogenesis protein PilO [Pyrinomonadaceae bacterium]|jgi:Tfp pilus assembly protein PilO|nr:type 4a pilus biogenesis protein PilO [Pyrinomonadaceae bacterium]